MSKARVSPTPPFEGSKPSQDVIDSVAGFMHNNDFYQQTRTRRSRLPPIQPDNKYQDNFQLQQEPTPGCCLSFTKRYFGDLRTSAKSAFVLLCIAYSMFQVVRTTIYYLEFDTGVAVAVEEPQDLKVSGHL